MFIVKRRTDADARFNGKEMYEVTPVSVSDDTDAKTALSIKEGTVIEKGRPDMFSLQGLDERIVSIDAEVASLEEKKLKVLAIKQAILDAIA